MTALASPLTGEALEAIEARAAKARPGPWEFASVTALRTLGVNVTAPDADFITAAREDVPALCREVRRLRAALEAITERKGPFDPEPLLHCHNVVESMAEIAEAALAPVATGPGDARD